MNSWQRVTDTIRHLNVHPVVKGELSVDGRFAIRFLRRFQPGKKWDALSDVQRRIACCKALDLDLVCIQSAKPTGNESGINQTAADIIQFSDQGLFVFLVVDGAFQAAMEQLGQMKVLLDIARSPDNLAERLASLCSRVISDIRQGVGAGAPGIIVADDIAYQHNTYMSPDFVRQRLLPLWRKQVTTARESGVPVFFHSDGNLSSVLKYVAAAGFDGIQCIEPGAGMDIGDVKRRFGRELCLMGSIDPALLYERTNCEEVENDHERLQQAVTRFMASDDGTGGLIFGTSSGLHSDMSPERVRLMYHLAHESHLWRQQSFF